MAELGVIASIVGIAGVGIKLSKTLYVTGDRAISAEHNLRRLATNVSLFSASLKHFAQVMQANENLYSPEFEMTARQIVAECGHVFEELTSMAFMANQKTEASGFGVNDSKKRFSLIQRVKVYFEQPKVDLLTAQLEYLKTTLSVLIQTLNLAAVTAKAKEDSETLSQISSEKIEQERIHVETLILARQLSVVILHQQQHNTYEVNKTEQGEVGRVSPAPSDDSIEEPTAQKLLAQEAAPSTGLVKLGRDNLEFLDSAMTSRQSQTLPPAMFTSHNQIIDQLLGRWTRLPEMEEDINARHRKEVDLEDQALEEPLIISDGVSPKAIGNPDAAAPDLKLQLVDSIGSSTITPELVTSPDLASPRTGHLDPQTIQNRPMSRTPPPPLASHTSYPLAQSPLSPSSGTNLNLHRSVSTPEALSAPPPQLRPFSPQPNNSNIVASYGSQTKQLNPYVPPPPLSFDQPPTSPATSPRTSMTSNANYDQSIRPGSSHQPGIARNPYAAYVSPAESPYGTSPDSDYEDDDKNRRLGLGIPWRIRIGAKYWDFLDERLVGPRTPYLPTEPMSWLYSHDYAHTEIAEKWVCEEAIAERNFPYTHIQGDDGGGNFATGRNQVWRILCPLKFVSLAINLLGPAVTLQILTRETPQKEIDALVERTIDIYRRKTTANPGPPTSSRSSDGPSKSHPVPIPVVPAQPWLANSSLPAAQQPLPHQTPQDASARARADVFNTWQQIGNPQQQRNQQPPSQQRSVSFQDVSHPPPRPGTLRTDFSERPHRVSGEFPGVTGGPEARGVYWGTQSTNGPPSSIAGTVGSNTGPGYVAPSASRNYREKDRERERDRYSRDRHEDDSDDYERQKRKTRGDRKKKKSSTAATLAKAAGLMTILDGLDAI